MSAISMTLLLAVSLGVFAWAAGRRWRQLRVGGPDVKLSLSGADLVRRAFDTLYYAFGQRKMPYYRVAGGAHILIFLGFNVLLLNTIQLWVRGYAPHFDFWGVLAETAPAGIAYYALKDTFVVLVALGALVFVYYRVVVRAQRMTLSFEALLILIIIFVMMVGDVLYYGAWKVLEARTAGEVVALGPDWVSSAAAMGLIGIASDSTLTVLAHVGFWTHSALVLIFLNILPFSKHFHVITAIPNVFLRDHAPEALPKVHDLEGKVEREESVGIAKLQDLSWKHILDLYTCTECGRCSDHCPAYMTGKKLSPKHLTLALRDHLYDTEEAMFGSSEGMDGTLRKSQSGGEREEIHTFPKPPAEAYYRASTPTEFVPLIIDPDVIWGCTSCRACEEQCPVMISYVDKIVGLRREQVLVKGDMPSELQRPFMGIESNGNPWNNSHMDRANWAHGLDVPLIQDHPDADVLYWVGCSASYDLRAQKTAQALVKLLRHAGVDFAILGNEEKCTGDPARRAGNEYLFQMMAEQNIEALNGVGADKKTILTACPHCFNTLANEYPDFGGHYQVVHHTAFLNGLVAQKKLVPEKPVNAKVAFHDSCYLGRYNGVYESPREILKAIPGVDLVEVEHWNRSRGLCCGAGGAQMFMEEQGEERVNNKRTLQLLDTGADTIASGCPFCMTMLSDGLKHHEKDEQVDQLDVVELLARSVNLETRE